jgi:hypothetical protein
MTAGKFDVSYSALTQVALLPPDERAALARLFASGEIEQPAITRRTSDGRFVSRFGDKKVLWQRVARNRPEIVSIVDRSYAQA